MEDERRRVVSVVRVKRKRGSAEAADVLFLQGKDKEEDEDERKANNAGRDTNGMKRRIKKNSCSTSNNKHKNEENNKIDEFVKGRYDRELAAQLDAVLGGGSQALPFHRNSHQTMKEGEGEGDFHEDEDEKKTKKKKSNGMLKKFVRLTREAGMEQNDARDAQTVKTLLESRRERRKGEDGGGSKTTTASTRTRTKRTYEEVKVIMGEEESMKSMTTTRRDRITDEEQRKKRNVLSTTTTTDSTKEVFYCYDILCRDEEEEKIEEEEKEKEEGKEGNRNDEKLELEDQILMNYMPLVKEYTEKKKREEEDADGNWVYDLYVLEQDDVFPKRGGTIETDDIICEEPIVRVSDFLDNANVEHNLHENEYFSEDDSEDSNAENYYRGDYPEEDTDDDDGFFDDGGDDSDRDEWDVDDEYDSDEEDDGYGRHRSDHGSGWGV